MSSEKIKNGLEEAGFNTDTVVSFPNRKEFYASGYESSDLPNEVNGYQPVDDPSLIDEASSNA